jgi:type II secretory pathway pseudopilin PulG
MKSAENYVHSIVRRGGLSSRRGFSLLETLIAGVVVAIVSMAGAAYVTRSTQGADWSRDRMFARQKALSILSELKSFVEGGTNQAADELDGFDDGTGYNATLSIAPDPADPTKLVPPEHTLSGNISDGGDWRWYRHVTVRRFSGVNTRDLRICTVRVWRHRTGDAIPGEQMAEVSSVVRTVADTYPTSQVYDVYLLALENVPGWWVYMDAMKPFIDATLSDLSARNPGLEFRTHWITKSGYGRDEEYAPYTNEARISTDNTPWAYVYPGKMPSGLAASRYYVPLGMGARMNLDGENTPTFMNDYAAPEPLTDTNGNGHWDAGESYTDTNGDGSWTPGNPIPYALADQQNHAMRWPEENAKFSARVAAGVEADDTPTYRLLLDRMIANPAQYHNAVLINLHGELLPMPAVRNYSDAAKDPVNHPGWRVAAHPETIMVRRVAAGPIPVGDAKWRVYAYKTEFPTTEALMTMREPFTDVNKNGVYDSGEPFQDWNANGKWDDMCPATMEIPGIDATAAINAASSPSMIVQRLPGGIDADASGAIDLYSPFANAQTYPETFTDANANGRRDVADPFFDTNGNGVWDAGEPFTDLNGTAVYNAVNEAFVDSNGNTVADLTSGPADIYTDVNGNLRWDAAEPFFDINGDGVRNPPTVPILPWRAWNPAIDNVNPAKRTAYATGYGEPYTDVDGNGAYSAAEPLLFDNNGNGRFDGGYKRGEMWFKASYDAARKSTIVQLYGTPLQCGETAYFRGLDAGQRLYDLDYIPCPMTTSASSAVPAFGRDLYDNTLDVPKNTARWTITIPFAKLKSGFASPAGANNGDATDRVLELRARVGSDLSTGTMWPTRNSPTNISHAWSYFDADPNSIPFSERYQFQGDPRHCPYADLDAYGTTFPNGYNWSFDNFNGTVNATANWKAIDTARLTDGWMGTQQIDTARYFHWMRTAVTTTEAIYTTLTGFSYFYLSVGGDVGYDSANGFASSIPMNGTPFGNATASIYEDTFADGGTAGVSGSQKYARSNNGVNTSVRSGGYWWGKPWLGELWQDGAYAGQWATWGNLRAAASTAALTYRMLNRGSMPSAQQPAGTTLVNLKARTGAEGSTSYFTIGSAASTYHHQFRDGETGTLTGDGPQLEANYNFPLPTTAAISRPFSLTTAADGGLPSEFTYTTDYPHFTAAKIVDFYNHVFGTTGSALVRHVDPSGTKAAHIVVNGIDRTVGSGSAFISRYALITLVHSFFASGLTGPGRVKQLPRIQIVSPTIITELTDPVTVPIQWSVAWTRWDGLKYTSAYPNTFTELESDLVYVLLMSTDNGRTWTNMKTGEVSTPGTLPMLAGVPDAARTWADAGTGNETWTWNTPKATYPEGSYLLRVDCFRKTENLHYASHQEKVYVNR